MRKFCGTIKHMENYSNTCIPKQKNSNLGLKINGIIRHLEKMVMYMTHKIFTKIQLTQKLSVKLITNKVLITLSLSSFIKSFLRNFLWNIFLNNHLQILLHIIIFSTNPYTPNPIKNLPIN